MITTTSVPDATVGSAYPASALQASGATKPVKWRLVGGALPRGLHVAANGLLKGKANKHDSPGTYSFTVEAYTHHPVLTSLQTTLTLTLLS